MQITSFSHIRRAVSASLLELLHLVHELAQMLLLLAVDVALARLDLLVARRNLKVRISNRLRHNFAQLHDIESVSVLLDDFDRKSIDAVLLEHFRERGVREARILRLQQPECREVGKPFRHPEIERVGGALEPHMLALVAFDSFPADARKAVVAVEIEQGGALGGASQVHDAPAFRLVIDDGRLVGPGAPGDDGRFERLGNPVEQHGHIHPLIACAEKVGDARLAIGHDEIHLHRPREPGAGVRRHGENHEKEGGEKVW